MPRLWSKVLALCLVAGSLWGGRAGWELLEAYGLPPQKPEPSGLQAQEGGANKTYLPFLAKSYALGPNVLGIDAGNLDDDAKVRKVTEAGAKWVRVAVSWSKVEPQNTAPAYFDWSESDAMLAKAAQSGLSPIVIIIGNPSWAAGTSCGPLYSAALPELAQFLTALVGRYGQPPYQVKYWELYNEPDNGNAIRYGWLGGCWGNNGREYGQLLQVAYPAIKAADLEAKVVFGSLAYDNFTETNGPFVRVFLDDALDPLKGNAGPFFDVFAFHYYYLFAINWESYGKDLIGKANFLRSKMASYGISKPMVLTEVGQPSGTSGDFQGSDDMQSSYVVQAFARSMASDLKVVIWYSLADYDAQKLGLLDSSLSPKPAYNAFKTLSAELAGAVYRRPIEASYLGVEGYVFSAVEGAGEKWVLWASGGTPVSLTLPASQARTVTKLGQASIVSDGADGAWDGQVHLIVTSSPLYLQLQP